MTSLPERSRYTSVTAPCCSLQTTIARLSSLTRAEILRFVPAGASRWGVPGAPLAGRYWAKIEPACSHTSIASLR